MAVLFTNKIDRLTIEVDGSEIPILDGSIEELNKIIQEQVIELDQEAKEFVVPFYTEIEGYSIFPSDSLEIYSYLEDPKTHAKTFLYWQESSELIPAKTYGYIQDYPILKELNLAKGSNIYNTTILSLNNQSSKPTYLANYHKIIDFLGDIYTTCIPYIKGIFYLHNPNHTKNNKIAITVYNLFTKGVIKDD